ncbi:MAG: cation acetate symporter [Planctomycetales bacterium]
MAVPFVFERKQGGDAMIYTPSLIAVLIFAAIVGLTLALSFYLGAKAKSASGYFAAGGGIHWFVNGVAFAGDYLSAASFLGICGMIAFYGYDGFLYSIGYLAGWIVALFVIAEPLKRMGKFTFADALDSQFNSRGIKLAAAVSTLAVSLFYLIPQMVGAGALIKPLLGFPHAVGVILVGAVVMIIVVTAGMVSTTYVQFLKGSLLVVFSLILTMMILERGLTTAPVKAEGTALPAPLVWEGSDGASSRAMADKELAAGGSHAQYEKLPEDGGWKGKPYYRLRDKETKAVTTWLVLPQAADSKRFELVPAQTVSLTSKGKLVNGLPQGRGASQTDLKPVGFVASLPNGQTNTGALGPMQFLATIQNSTVELWSNEVITEADGSKTTVYFPKRVPGREIMRPGNLPAFKGIRSDKLTEKFNFISLMLALFCGTASLPHVLIRYYTVKDQAAARKSTIVGIGSIGFFYILTLFIGLGAMTSGALDVTNTNMAAPLLAKSFNQWLFAIISAIAFTTVLGTVSGLILAAAGAVVHDLMSNFLKIEMNDHSKVRVAKFASVLVGIVAIILGIVFEKMNVNYLVGWAFSVAASANLPSLVMLLFWKRTTAQGITAAITVGMFSSLAWILTSADTFKDVYGLPPEKALVPFSQPGIVTIPLGFAVLILVSLVTKRNPSPAA